jgi:hypothetical protein
MFLEFLLGNDELFAWIMLDESVNIITTINVSEDKYLKIFKVRPLLSNNGNLIISYVLKYPSKNTVC